MTDTLIVRLLGHLLMLTWKNHGISHHATEVTSCKGAALGRLGSTIRHIRVSIMDQQAQKPLNLGAASNYLMNGSIFGESSLTGGLAIPLVDVRETQIDSG